MKRKRIRKLTELATELATELDTGHRVAGGDDYALWRWRAHVMRAALDPEWPAHDRESLRHSLHEWIEREPTERPDARTPRKVGRVSDDLDKARARSLHQRQMANHYREELVVLAYRAGLSYQEITELTGLPREVARRVIGQRRPEPLTAMPRQLAELRRQLAQAATEEVSLRAALDELRRQHRQATSERDALRAERADHGADQIAEREAATTERDELRERVTGLEAERDELRRQRSHWQEAAMRTANPDEALAAALRCACGVVGLHCDDERWVYANGHDAKVAHHLIRLAKEGQQARLADGRELSPLAAIRELTPGWEKEFHRRLAAHAEAAAEVAAVNAAAANGLPEDRRTIDVTLAEVPEVDPAEGG